MHLRTRSQKPVLEGPLKMDPDGRVLGVDRDGPIWSKEEYQTRRRRREVTEERWRKIQRKIEESNKKKTEELRDDIRERTDYKVVPMTEHEANFKGLIGYHVPMSSQRELDGWLEFLKYDNGNPIAFSRAGRDQEKDIDLMHPFLHIVAEFALSAFNEMCLKAIVAKGGAASEGLTMTRILKAIYISEFPYYIIKITFEAKEDGVPALLFLAIIEADRFNGFKTLLKFVPLPLQFYGKLKVLQPDLSGPIAREEAMRGKEKANQRRREDGELQMIDSAIPSGLFNIYGMNICMAYGYVIPLPEYRFNDDL